MFDEITNLVTTLGFPVVCVIACAYFINVILSNKQKRGNLIFFFFLKRR